MIPSVQSNVPVPRRGQRPGNKHGKHATKLRQMKIGDSFVERSDRQGAIYTFCRRHPTIRVRIQILDGERFDGGQAMRVWRISPEEALDAANRNRKAPAKIS